MTRTSDRPIFDRNVLPGHMIALACRLKIPFQVRDYLQRRQYTQPFPATAEQRSLHVRLVNDEWMGKIGRATW